MDYNPEFDQIALSCRDINEVWIIDHSTTTAEEGTPTIGQTFTGEARHFYLCAPTDGGHTYFLLASLTATTGIPSCGGTLPLDLDPLLNLTLGAGTIFQNPLGTLNTSGTTKAPTLPIPPDPTLVGFHLESAFVVLDFTQPCFLRRISESYPMTIID